MDRKRSTPPKIQGWPWIGTVPHFYRQQLDFLLNAREQYGDVFRIQLGDTEITILGHPRHAQHVLVDQARNYRNKGSSGFRIAPLPVMRSGLATATENQEPWRQQRRGVQPYFDHSRLGALTNLMNEAIAESLAQWPQRMSSGGLLNLEEEITRMTINVVGQSIFGISIPPEEAADLATEVRVLMDYLWQGTIENAIADKAIAKQVWSTLIPGRARYQQAAANIDAAVESLIARALQPSAKPDNLMQILTELVDEGALSHDQRHNEAVTMVITGYESTAASLSWAFHLLTTHPTVMHRLQREVDSALGASPPTYAAIPALAYPRMVFQEALRLYAPSYWTQRMAAEDDEIDGFHIPAGAIVSPLLHLVHMHPEIWETPQQFDPERFRPERVADRHKFAWIPFGAGQRMCMAIEFALIKGQLILAHVIQNYQLTAIPNKSPTAYVRTNVRPKTGVWVTATKRQQEEAFNGAS